MPCNIFKKKNSSNNRMLKNNRLNKSNKKNNKMPKMINKRKNRS